MSHKSGSISITELPNDITLDVDICTAAEIPRLLRQTDAQLFAGFKHFPGMLDSENIGHVCEVATHFADVISENFESLKKDGKSSGRVFFSGCGTSGRLAYFCARRYNTYLQNLFSDLFGAESAHNLPKKLSVFDYLIAGSDKALVVSQESAEDDPIAGGKELVELFTNAGSKHVYVGVTCGFSAAYVAGQIQATLDRTDCATVLMGFNPTELARKVAIEKWDRTFADVVQAMVAKQEQEAAAAKPHTPEGHTHRSNRVFLNPVIGPEAVTGSTRMKGGSATVILLDVAFAIACSRFERRAREGRAKESAPEFISHEEFAQLGSQARALFDSFQATASRTYHSSPSLSRVIETAGRCLHAQGHICYLSSHPTFGVLCFVDASECVPTYGSAFSDVRGFVDGGWDSIEPKTSTEVMNSYGDRFHVSLDTFTEQVLPSLSCNDLVIFVGEQGDKDSNALSLFHRVRDTTSCHLAEIRVHYCASPIPQTAPDSAARTTVVNIAIPFENLFSPIGGGLFQTAGAPLGFAEFGVKLALNAITTGGHVLKGMTYSNRMINVRVSNNKLYYRAIGIVAKVGGVSDAVATECVLRAIYERPEFAGIAGDYRTFPVSKHIENAVWTSKVVPVAILLASGKFERVEDALAALELDPILRNVIAKFK